jgi:hypothetical protein
MQTEGRPNPPHHLSARGLVRAGAVVTNDVVADASASARRHGWLPLSADAPRARTGPSPWPCALSRPTEAVAA